ncbi:calcium uptake protein 3, mitochondrial isoform X5 [Gallus gallus]|uniref:calcium uptake protein 3, mitochondrial isoform X5 n=1 Tax=Gallus gallus TaxID=9031 RepID=UPI001AE378C7|nr:calcium uptake protein 3, mitochondrial isoform X5 [Gallus gallus]XP_040555342.1 calcium uptake protein 3, mitochondrial isoform X5 [Gallus gallus]
MAALRTLLRWRRRLGSAPSAPSARRLWAGGGAGPAGPRRWRRELGWAAGAALAGYAGYQLSERRREPSRQPAAAEAGGARALLPIPVAAAAKETVTENRSDLEDLHLYATPREQRFRRFASLEFEGQLYMTPYDFIQAVTNDEPKRAKKWRSLSKQELNQILMETPPVWKGSSKLFRNLNEKGVISYTEYLFLLCILTKPHAGFRIAFNMFDTDGNEMVDKKEFLVLQEIFRKKNEKRERKGDEEKRAMLRSDDLASSLSDTTLLVHFFGKKGKAELNFEDFYRFMDNLQTEVLEIEFLSYSNGMNTISEEDFAHILLRYTNVENTSSYLENMRCRIPEEKGITFDEFRSFFQFLNNLEDFTIAMQMYNFASRSIGQDEFKRAVYVATGVKLSPHLVNTVFKIFDVDRDDQLSYKEFIGIMKDRLNRGFRESPKYGWKEYYSCVMTVTSEHLRDLWKQFRRRDMLR